MPLRRLGQPGHPLRELRPSPRRVRVLPELAAGPDQSRGHGGVRGQVAEVAPAARGHEPQPDAKNQLPADAPLKRTNAERDEPVSEPISRTRR